MSLVTLRHPIIYPHMWHSHGAPTTGEFNGLAGFALSSGSQRHAWVVCAPKSGNITHVAFMLTTVTTDVSLDMRIETVGTDGNPTGTLWATNTKGTSPTTHSINIIYDVALTANATVNMGEYFAIVMQFTNSGDAGNVTVADGVSSNTYIGGRIPYNVRHNGTSYTKDDLYPFIRIKMSSTIVAIPGAFFSGQVTAQTETWDSGSNPDERGIRFQVPCKLQIGGIVAAIRGASGQEWEARLYDGSTSAPAATDYLRIAKHRFTSWLNVFSDEWVFWDHDADSAKRGVFTVEPNTWYRLVVQAKTTTSCQMEHSQPPDNDTLDCWPGGKNWYKTARLQSGPGTFTDTTTESYPGIRLIVTALEDGVNAKLLPHRGMVGGMAA